MRKVHNWRNPGFERFEDAAVTVLKRSHHPLAVREIVEEMVELRLVEPSGKTPQNSMQNTIRRANERRKEKGEPILFVPKRDGKRLLYSLND